MIRSIIDGRVVVATVAAVAVAADRGAAAVVGVLWALQELECLIEVPAYDKCFEIVV